VASAFRPPPAAAPVERLYDATAQSILAVVKEVGSATHTLLIVGHNPGLHDLAMMLIASGDVQARERLWEKLPTSGLVIIDFAFDYWVKLHHWSGRIHRFLPPKSLGYTNSDNSPT